MLSHQYFYFFLFYIVPTPDLSIRLSTDNFIAGSELTITCDITIDLHVNTPFIVNTTWTKLSEVNRLKNMTPEVLKDSPGSGQSRFKKINFVQAGYNKYHFKIYFSILSSSMDSGTYTCIVDVIPLAGYIYITAPNTTRTIVNVTIKGSGCLLVTSYIKANCHKMQ